MAMYMSLTAEGAVYVVQMQALYLSSYYMYARHVHVCT